MGACASAVRSEGMKERQHATRVHLGVRAQPMCRASLRSFEDITKVSSPAHVYSPCIFDDLLVVSETSSARWLAAAAMPFPGVTGTKEQ